MYFTIITALKKLFKNKILIFKIKLFAQGELFQKNTRHFSCRASFKL